MKQLNTYIQEGLFKNVGIGSDVILDRVKEWVEKNFNGSNIKYEFKNGNVVVSASDIWTTDYTDITSLNNDGMFEWGDIKEDFGCALSTNLISLKGAPKKCRQFFCNQCSSLESLEGGPEECERFDCRDCISLESLKGAPKKCKYFVCSFTKIKDLTGISQDAEYIYADHNVKLTSFKGAPKKCKYITVSGCLKLNSLKYAPECEEFSFVNGPFKRFEVEEQTKATLIHR